MASSERTPMNLMLEIQLPEVDDLEYQEHLTRNLHNELLELDLSGVEIAQAGKAPPGTKSAEAFSAGTLLVSLLPAAVPKLIEFLQSWVSRVEDRKVHIKSQVGDRTIELDYSPKSITTQEINSIITALTSPPAEKPARRKK